MAEEDGAVGALPLRIGWREMLADVAQSGCPQQCVGNGMEDDVGIAVAGKPALMRNLNSAHHQRPLAGECMNVESHPGPRNEPDARHASARSQSAAVVNFSSMGSPSTTATLRPAARRTVDSSVGAGPGPLRICFNEAR